MTTLWGAVCCKRTVAQSREKANALSAASASRPRCRTISLVVSSVGSFVQSMEAQSSSVVLLARFGAGFPFAAAFPFFFSVFFFAAARRLFFFFFFSAAACRFFFSAAACRSSFLAAFVAFLAALATLAALPGPGRADYQCCHRALHARPPNCTDGLQVWLIRGPRMSTDSFEPTRVAQFRS